MFEKYRKKNLTNKLAPQKNPQANEKKNLFFFGKRESVECERRSIEKISFYEMDENEAQQNNSSDDVDLSQSIDENVSGILNHIVRKLNEN